MDKHDRPYKCHASGCEKLQGFTYSGGLLRHERKVHKLHGGTKKSLFCPYGDCKRSSGAGFTRKENLAEHIHRVHRKVSASSDTGLLGLKREDNGDEVESLEDLREEEPQGDNNALGKRKRKRKRISNARELVNGDVDDFNIELLPLRPQSHPVSEISYLCFKQQTGLQPTSVPGLSQVFDPTEEEQHRARRAAEEELLESKKRSEEMSAQIPVRTEEKSLPIKFKFVSPAD